MSLRGKLLLLWGGLAVTPLLAIGIFEYFHSVRTLRTLIASQAGTICERAALEIADRHARRTSDLLLVGENRETQRLYEAYAGGDSALIAEARSAAESYLRQAWEMFGDSYRWIDLRDSADVRILHLGEYPGLPDAELWDPAGEDESGLLLQSVRKGSDGRAVGSVVARVPPDVLLPRQTLETTFGRTGYSTVIDRATNRVLYHPRRAVQSVPASTLLGPAGWDVDPELLEQEQGSFIYQESDSTRVASFVSLTDPPWAIISSGTLEEFAPSVAGMRVVNLFLVLLVTVVASVAFILVTRRGTRSLIALTSAADEVGEGNFAPCLPAAGGDEVGRLTTAFGLMVERVEDMVRQIETSRHMAAVGEFASQVSHEIRNPLTSLKLNLQTLQRASLSGRIPEDQSPAVDTCLQEIQRLDRVVRGVLTLGRRSAPMWAPQRVHTIVDAALKVIGAQAEEREVRVDADLLATQDGVSGDGEQLEGAFLNLLLNGLDAAGPGGRVQVVTGNLGPEGGAPTSVSIQVHDSGPGVPMEARDRIFRPFFSSKPQGSGFGLPLALRTIEEHRGRLILHEEPSFLGGAAFIVELPLLPQEAGP